MHGRQQVLLLGVGRVQPFRPVAGRDHHRRPVVDLADLIGRVGRDDRARPVPGVLVIVGHLLVPPQLVQAGEGEDAAVRPVDVERLLGLRVRVGLPLVVAVGRDEAATLGERGAEGGLDRDRLGPRVDQPGAALGVLGPERHQAPAQQPELALLLVVHHRVDPLGRRHVVVGVVGRPLGGNGVPLDGELLEQLGPFTSGDEPTAHERLLPRQPIPSRLWNQDAGAHLPRTDRCARLCGCRAPSRSPTGR